MSDKAAIERVRVVLEEQFLKLKSGRPRKDVVKILRYDYADYYLFANGKWSTSERLYGLPIDHFELDSPESGETKYSSKGRHRGAFGRTAKALVRLGIVSAADYEVVRAHLYARDKRIRDRQTKRDLEWKAEQLGVKLVYPKKLLDDSKLARA